MTAPSYHAVIVVGATPTGECGHCGSAAVLADPDGRYCLACFHWVAYWGLPPEAKTIDELASTFNGAKGAAS